MATVRFRPACFFRTSVAILLPALTGAPVWAQSETQDRAHVARPDEPSQHALGGTTDTAEPLLDLVEPNAAGPGHQPSSQRTTAGVAAPAIPAGKPSDPKPVLPVASLSQQNRGVSAQAATFRYAAPTLMLVSAKKSAWCSATLRIDPSAWSVLGIASTSASLSGATPQTSAAQTPTAREALAPVATSASKPEIRAPKPLAAELPAQPFRPLAADVAAPFTPPSCLAQQPIPNSRTTIPVSPAPPTAGVSMSVPPASAAPVTSPIIPSFIGAATVITTVATIGLIVIFGRLTSADGRSRRAMTLAARITLAFGSAATLAIGLCCYAAFLAPSIGSQITCVVLAVAAGTLCAGGGFWLARAVVAPVGRVVDAARSLASGNLMAPPINSAVRDELGELSRALDKLGACVKDIVSEVAISSSTVAEAARELAVGAQGMSSAAGAVSTNCAMVVGDASSTGRLAASGGRSLQQATAEIARAEEIVHGSAGAVRALADRGRQVARVVELIDDISDRTHLVAINASIEASRGGPNARAFAVLADEVRRLAERAQQATEEAAVAVRAVQDDCTTAAERMSFGSAQIKQGADLAGRAGLDIQEIIRTAGGVSSIIQTISAAAEEAGAGAAQSAGAAAQLSTRAENLRAMVARFRLDTSSFLSARAT